MMKNIAPVFLALLLTYSPPCLANNTAYGTAAGADLTTGTDNTIIGTEAGVSVTTGTDNTLLGYESGKGVTGSHNIILGEDPSSAITTGSSNILVGNSLTEVTNTTSSQLDIGDTLYGTLGGSGAITAANNFTALGTITGNLFSGSGASLTSLDGSNISSGTVAAAYLPTGTVITSTASPVQGDVLYYNGSNWVDLAAGMSGYFLETQGASANPIWAVAGSGTVDSGTQYQMGYYASTGTAISGDSSIVTDSSGDLSLGNGSYQLNAHAVLAFPDADTTSIAVGKSALTSQSSTSLNNTAVGDTALGSMTSGMDSTAVGSAALYSATGSPNTTLGYKAGYAVTTGTDNTLVGYESGLGVTGSHNIILGEDPSSAITSGSSNILVGNSLTDVTNTTSSQLDIGDTLYGTLGGSGTITAVNNFMALGTITGNLFSGSGASLTSLNGSNISSGTIAAAYLPAGAVITNTASPAQGDILYYNGSNWTDLAAGTSGYFLKTQGASANPTWAAAGNGTVNSGTQYQIGYYAATGTAISGDSSLITDSSGDLSLGSGSYQLNANTVLAFPDADTTSIAVGKSALTSQSATSSANTAIGDLALNSITTGTESTAVGYDSLTGATGSPNTALGYKSGDSITTGTDNTLVGYESGKGVTGSHNIILGEDPSSAITSGSSNILIGNSLTEVTNSSSTQLDIGDTIYGSFEATSGGTVLTIGTSSDTGVTLTIAGEGSMIVPSGTTAERPSSTTNGQIRYNSSLAALEAYVNGAWATITSGSSSTPQLQNAFLTSGTSWSTPSGITSATVFKVTAVGAGGGGAGYTGANGGSVGGGGGGATCFWWVSGLSPSTGYTYAIGSAGTAGSSSGGTGGTGGSTTFSNGSTTMTAGGGVGGSYSTGLSTALPGLGGSCTNGTFGLAGGSGTVGQGTATNYSPAGGAGGTTMFGFGGRGGNSTPTNPTAGTGCGGGGGAAGDTGGGAAGAAGAAGCILIEWIQ